MGADDERRWLEILRSNLGFETPEDWVDFARTNAFKRVAATPVVDCPDCGAAAGDQ